MENKGFLTLLLVIAALLALAGNAQAGTILLQEEAGQEPAIVRVSEDGTRLRQIGRGMFPESAPGGKFISYARVSPASGTEFIIADPEGKEVARIEEIRSLGSIVRYAWNPNGNEIAFITFLSRPNVMVSKCDMRTKKLKILREVTCGDVDAVLLTSTLDWSPDGGKLAFSLGGFFSKDKGVILIEPETGRALRVSDAGSSPKFIGPKRLVFGLGTEIWQGSADGRVSERMLDTGKHIVSISRVVKGRSVVQVKEGPDPASSRLLLLDLGKKKVEPVETSGHLLLSPRMSPGGDKFTALGMKTEGGRIGEGMPSEAGYYVYDLKSGRVGVLKRFGTGDIDGFFSKLLLASLGHGNFTSWE